MSILLLKPFRYCNQNIPNMRNLFLTICLLLSARLYAQPNLTGSACNPVPGDKFYQHYCDYTGVSEGAAGHGVTWNFASLSELGIDSMTYDPCLGTLYCDSFSGSNLSTHDNYGYYEYYVGDAGQFAEVGEGDSYVLTYYTDPLALLKYPMSIDTVAIDTYFSYTPAYAYYDYQADTMIGDGYGTLILPSGTYNNVLRVHLIAMNDDSDISVTPAVVTHARNDIYMWWTPGFHNPLLIMGYDTSVSTSIEFVSYYTKPALVPSSVKEVLPVGDVRIYPNPVRDRVNISYASPNRQEVSVAVTDMSGRLVGDDIKQTVNEGANTISYPLSSLPSGIYLLRLQTGDGVIVRKFQVVH